MDVIIRMLVSVIKVLVIYLPAYYLSEWLGPERTFIILFCITYTLYFLTEEKEKRKKKPTVEEMEEMLEIVKKIDQYKKRKKENKENDQ